MEREPGLRITRMDPWGKQPAGDSYPGLATFVGRYRLCVGALAEFDEALFITGGPGAWALWAVADDRVDRLDQVIAEAAGREFRNLVRSHGGPAVAGVLDAVPREAARALFKALIRTRVHDSTPMAPFVGGLLPAVDLEWEVSSLQSVLERNRLEALVAERAVSSPILATARAFGLGPEPAGQHPEAWRASCPCGGSHWIMISTRSNEFGCGYCRKKGGPEELRAFCLARGRKERTP